MNQITITKPDDWHLHFRDGEMLKETVAATSRCFSRAIVMPNLVPPVVTADQAIQYKQRIINAVPQGHKFEPLMVLYLSKETTAKHILDAKQQGIVAAKLYPQGATTNSESGVSGVESLYPVFETMSEVDMLLLIHGEETDSDIDIFDREKAFIDRNLIPIREHFPDLRIVFEHITTADAADYVLEASPRTAATITPQHLLLNRNDLLVGGIRPHNYCLPVLKRNTHQQRLREVVASGSTKFFLGTDSAPHTKHTKETACGCAGCYSAPAAIELYAQVFDDLGALDKLEAFASFNGADFYQLERNTDTITLKREEWTMQDEIELADGSSVVPFYAGQELRWKLKNN